MSATPTLPDGELERLAVCVREHIRRPGSIQPHGALVTADPSSWTIVQASANCEAVLGTAAERLHGSPLDAVTGSAAVESFAAVLSGAHGVANPVSVTTGGRSFDAIAHEVDGVAVIEFEPALPPEDFSSASAIYAAMHRLATVTDRDQLWSDAARELAALTGFDRVMIYHFHPDGHGQVVAEEIADESMEPYYGLHYPASDIPHQARELYLAKLSRTIYSTDGVAIPLLPAESPVTGEPLDLSYAELRSISPHHLQFMRNIGQASTLSFSLIFNGELIGMITCAHRTTRRLPYTLRHGLEVFGNQVALQLSAMAEIRRLTRTTQLAKLRSELAGQFAAHGDMEESLLHAPVTVLDLVPAAGAALCLDGHVCTIGDAPDAASINMLVDALRATTGGALSTFASDSLAVEHPELARIVPTVAGLLIVPFGGEGGYLAWFRPEITETTEWLGDQSAANRDSVLSPRNSFSAWSESVKDKAESWGDLEREAIELGRDLDSALMRRAESALAHLGLHDALTGLPNRRMLLDRLQHVLTGPDPRGNSALLFIDLDGFKAINDSLGHDRGDAVLQRVAERILSATRAVDTVARLGGDEFVILCQNTDSTVADHVAERVLRALNRPLAVEGYDRPIHASIGIATAQTGDTAAVDVIRRADEAMYRAKNSGKNRFSR
ncbi:bifunctional diguanylate cyclase/phosphodiesterase [Planctomonas psychrotolerans]|uniref:bifunctional diguanylate cyclase/phosphodiesterase n=1 Tax=Planctomonas psychrotolerans TaxID=2528712 RepID=UPI001D0CE622|nr:sensor domain-containing diguanylate cyclase [Planctomonas psychrotolerans]